MNETKLRTSANYCSIDRAVVVDEDDGADGFAGCNHYSNNLSGNLSSFYYDQSDERGVSPTLVLVG